MVWPEHGSYNFFVQPFKTAVAANIVARVTRRDFTLAAFLFHALQEHLAWLQAEFYRHLIVQGLEPANPKTPGSPFFGRGHAENTTTPLTEEGSRGAIAAA